ncbi:MAG: PIN domain-containing protein [Prevotella sp.]|nr:PIN domain-containing protein [Prevotella sp.]
MKAFLDTNILVDLVCSREPFLQDAQNLFAECVSGRLNLCVSALSFVNTVYIGRKYGFVDIREKLFKISQIIDVVDLKGNTVVWALDCGWKDYEDAVQFGNATSTFSDCIVTRNKKDFSASDLPVYTVKELLELL